MPSIKLLDKSVSELIAAGEVIEKPASVIKELIENSIDAGARHITVEIKNGGISYMRVTDDGCGIAYDEMPTAFLRHATSKIRTGEDLVKIGTLGFRGEALASVAAVSKTELMSKRKEDELGGRIELAGGVVNVQENCGCPDGTTIVIRDLFYNTPARLKFLKKDVSEGNYVSAVVDKLALANPSIAFRFIRDNKTVRNTYGDGKLISAITAVYGKQFALSLVPVDFSLNDISVKGYVCSPVFCRQSRSMQTFFVNGRYIKSTTCMAALEEGYKNSMMTGKFPACVLDLTVSPENVDVNVHPAKTEVKFAYEKPVFDCIYLGTKNALLNGEDKKRQIELESVKRNEQYTPEKYFSRTAFMNTKTEQQKLENPFAAMFSELEKNDVPEKISAPFTPKQVEYETPRMRTYEFHSPEKPHVEDVYEVSKTEPIEAVLDTEAKTNEPQHDMPPLPSEPPMKVMPSEELPQRTYINPIASEKSVVCEPEEEEKDIRVIGEFSHTYIICEAGDELIIIDKHAAHERIRFEKLKSEFTQTSQLLADVTELQLSPDEYDALEKYYEYVESAGIELIFGEDCKVGITAVPSVITLCSPEAIVADIARMLIDGNTKQEGMLFDDMLHTMACKSAIKANDYTAKEQLDALARRVYNDRNIRFCPHGRPVLVALKKSRIEHFFDRS